jgi:hypothetical protein
MKKQHVSIVILVSVLSITPIGAGAEDSYQKRVLFSPGPEILRAEAAGRVMIYDGLRNRTVEKALDDQFGRIENMMFIRTVYTLENGEDEVDDDCD